MWLVHEYQPQDRLTPGRRTEAAHSSFASQVRAALTGEHQRIHALRSGLEGLEFDGREDDAGANLKT